MSDSIPTPLLDPLEHAAESVNYFLIIGALFALNVVVAKWFFARDGKVKLGPLELPVCAAWLGIALLTLAHLYFSWSLLVHVSAVLDCGNAPWSTEAWRALTNGKMRLLADMGVREPMGCGLDWLICSSPSEIKWTDTLMMAHVGLAALSFLATACWKSPAGWSTRALTTLAAFFFVLLNWWAGSQWALLASDLDRTGRSDPPKAGQIQASVQGLASDRARCQ